MTPTKAPRTDDDCWPFACRDYHATAVHQDGTEPCACPCHPAPVIPLGSADDDPTPATEWTQRVSDADVQRIDRERRAEAEADQGNDPDGHPCRLSADGTRRECTTPGCTYTGHPLTVDSADNTDPAECCGAEPGAPCRSWCVNAARRVIPETSTYANRTFVLVGTDYTEAQRWARENRPSGWTVKSVTAVRGTGRRNWTVRFNRAAR